MVNIYSAFETNQLTVEHVGFLKQYIAKQLTCGDIQLKADEVSVRLLDADTAGMIADMELEIFAHNFKDRIDKQDEICLSIRKYILSLGLSTKDVRVWLVLSEVGHSWN